MPISRQYGFDRGVPVDRHYIDAFMRRHGSFPGYATGSIRGRVLEIGGRDYVDRFGAELERVDVLHESDANPEATIVGNLTDPGVLPAEAFDCIVCVQTLHVIYDVPAVLRELHRALRPGGALLATGPGITRSCLPDRDHWGDWWRFTSLSLERLVREAFPGGQVHVEAYGNVLAAVAFLHGLAAEELRPHELEVRDPDFEVIVAARAVKALSP
ncbi:MAG: methyltransferase domain-containing protein [Solirubrobacterales bacterium]|nr:methyltransferase domain-containing protein [Solirubrobacterales bacterium]